MFCERLLNDQHVVGLFFLSVNILSTFNEPCLLGLMLWDCNAEYGS